MGSTKRQNVEPIGGPTHQKAAQSGPRALLKKVQAMKFKPDFFRKLTANDPGTVVLVNKNALWTPAHAQGHGQNFASVDAAVDAVKTIYTSAGMKVSDDAVYSSFVDNDVVTLVFNGSGSAHDEAYQRLRNSVWLQHQAGAADIGTMVTLWPERGGIKLKQNLFVFNT